MHSRAYLIAALLLVAGCCRQTAADTAAPLSFPEAYSADGQLVDQRIYGIYAPYDETIVLPAPTAPKGYEPVYLTHYGRHGARFLVEDRQYDNILNVLVKAHSEGLLSPTGEELYAKYAEDYPKVERRSGDLTQIGQRQHRGIARRMWENYPELLHGSSAWVEATSTNLQRTLLSMTACFCQLKELEPELRIGFDASKSSIHTLNPHAVDGISMNAFDRRWRDKARSPWVEPYAKYRSQNIDTVPLAQRLFTDPAQAQAEFDLLQFSTDLYYFATHVYGVPDISNEYYCYFSLDELVRQAQCDNWFYYTAKGPEPTGYGRGWALGAYMLDDILERSEEDLEKGVTVRLRFGHDGCIMAMYCMMGLDGWSTRVDTPEEVWGVWDSSAIPKASNIQIVVYRSKDESEPMLMTYRYNERPQSLPIEEACPGFYRWDDFKAYCREKCDAAHKILEDTKDLI